MGSATTTDFETFTAAFDELRRTVRRARSRVADDVLSLPQYDLLVPLLDAERAPGLRELAQQAGVSPPTATRMLDGLEARGLVTRERSAVDRRAVVLALTADGEALVRERRRRFVDARRVIFERLSPEDREAAARVLATIAEVYGELGD